MRHNDKDICIERERERKSNREKNEMEKVGKEIERERGDRRTTDVKRK